MRINHNIAALNTYRQLSANTVNTSKSLEKLSSGLRINRAGDDAAGLAISEKMRSQIRGLDTAARNANDGISLIQTAEGALNETHSILQRMKELAVQAANDTNTDADRAEIQKEIDQLTAEITRIAEQTEFNTKKLLDGSMAYGTKMSAGTSITATSIAPGANVTAGTYHVSVDYTAGSPESTVHQSGTYTGNVTGSATYDGTNWINDADGSSIFALTGLTVTDMVAGDKITLTAPIEANVDINATVAENVTVSAALDGINVGDGTYTLTYSSEGEWTVSGETVDPEDYGLLIEVEGTGTPATGNTIEVTVTNAVAGVSTLTPRGPIAAAAKASVTDAHGNAVTASNFSFSYASGLSSGTLSDSFTVTDNSTIFHIGANSSQNTSLSINNMDAASLGVNALDLTSQSSADEAITTIDEAISKVSSQRAALGAMQNRLEHTINNLGTAAENLTAAESRIRDVDMAKEMMEFTKNSILSQASQAMLAQANLQPQSVLQLLQ